MSKIKNYTEAGTVAGRYGWYINNAFRALIDERTEQIRKGRATVAASLIEGTPEYKHRNMPFGQDIYISTERMADEVERSTKEYQQAWDALKAVGIE